MPRLAFALLALAAIAAPVPKVKEKVPPFPVEVGTNWEYIRDGDEKDVGVKEITESTEKDGVVTIRVEYKSLKGIKTFDKLQIKDGEVWCLVSDEAKCDPPMLVWKPGAKAGDAWTNELKKGGQAYKTTTTVGESEEITTPAGKFTATPVTVRWQNEDGAAEQVSWIADGVGLVRHTYDGEKHPLQELKSFTPAKK